MDELGDVGSVATSIVESSTMTVTVPSGDDESLMENMEGEVEGSYDGEDGEEIMIEVVGSDVFVDGVGGNDEGLGKEGLGRNMESFGDEGMIGDDIGSREVGVLGGQYWDGSNETGVEEFQDIPGALDEISGQAVEKEVVEAQKVEMSVREEGEGEGLVERQMLGGAELVDDGDKASGKQSQGTGILDDGVWNPGIDDVVVSSLPVLEQEISVDKEGLSRKTDQSSAVEMVESISEASDKDNACHASGKFLDNPSEAVVRRHIGLVTTEESSPGDTRNTETTVDDQNFQSSTEGEPMKDDQTVDDTVTHGNSGADILSSFELPNSIRETEIIEHGDGQKGKFEDSGVEPEAPFSDGKNEATCSEDFPSMKQATVYGNHSDIHTVSESSLDPVERGEWIVMDIDEVLDFKDETIVLDVPDSVLRPAETVEVHSGESTIVSDCGDVAAKATSSQTETGMNDIKAAEDLRRGEGPVQSGFAIVKDHTGLAVENVEVIAGKEFVTESNSLSSNDPNGSAIPLEPSAEPQVTAPVCDTTCGENILPEVHNNKIDKGGLSKGQDGTLGYYHMDVAAGMPNTSIQADSNIEASSSIQDEKQEGVAQLSETLVHDLHVDHTTDTPTVSEIANEGTYTASISNVQVSSGSQSAGTSACSLGEGDVDPSDGNESINIDAVSHKTSQLNGDPNLRTSGSDAMSQLIVKKIECCQSNDNDVMQVDIPEIKSEGDKKDTAFGEQFPDERQVDYGEEDKSMGEHASEMDQLQVIEEETTKTPTSVSIDQPGYLMGPGNEGDFSITDLVWGKVRSHPWWPGQIFDPADASDKAVKYCKKDCFLVAYFGDRTFAWNDASLLKPFRPNFSQIEKQSNSEAFQNAVSCALDEVSRRVELGLSCSCVARDARDRIECQIVENTGIREESSRRYGVDGSTGASSFEPEKLLKYMSSLAESPFCLADRLELVLAQAQLSAFCCFNGYREPPTFESRDAMFEKDAHALELSDSFDQAVPASNDDEQLSSPHKHKQNLKDSLHSRKERSLSELMGDAEYSPDDEDDSDSKALSKSISTPSGKKRKAVDSLTDGSDRRISIYAAKVSTTSSNSKPSFKVGDCIRRVASQLTGSAPVLKGINEQEGTDTSLATSEDLQQGIMVPTEISSLEDILSQLQLAARDPKKGYSFLSNIITFFSGFRNSVVRKHTSAWRSGGGRKRKANHTASGATEEFEFDDINDSYWTDRIVQNYSEEQLLQISENGDKDYQLVDSDANKFRRSGRGSHPRKRYSNGNYETLADEQSVDVDRKKLELSPAELIITFAEGDSLPSEINLNKMFRRFGPLRESETEVALDSHRARVIFKRGADAEAAYSSAGRINIFGSMLVSYQLSYSPSTNFNSLPPLMLQGSDEAT